MDILETAVKVVKICVKIKQMYDTFAKREKFVEECIGYMISIQKPLEQYVKSKNEQELLQRAEAIKNLLTQLEKFDKFIEKLQKRGKIMAFLAGKSEVTEAEEFKKQLSTFVTSLQLNIQIENQDKLNQIQNYLEKLSSNTNIQKYDSFISKFQSKKAGEIWVNYHKNQEQVDWKDFKNSLLQFIYQSERKQLKEEQLEYLRLKYLDNNGDCTIEYEEWDAFYYNYWSFFAYKAEILSYEKDEHFDAGDFNYVKQDCLHLVINKVQNNDVNTALQQKQYGITAKFLIDWKGLQDSKYYQKNLLSDEYITIGRSANIALGQIDGLSGTHGYFSIKTYAGNPAKTGFYYTDQASLTPTSFVIEDKPYKLNQGQVIVFPNNIKIVIKKIYPEPADEINQAMYFVTNCYNESQASEKKLVSKDFLNQSMKYIPQSNEAPYILVDVYPQEGNINFFDFNDNDKFEHKFQKTKPDLSDYVISIGKNQKNVLSFPDAKSTQFQDFQCQIVYTTQYSTENQGQWYIVEKYNNKNNQIFQNEKRESLQRNISLSTFLVMKSDAQLIKQKEQKKTTKSFPQQIHSGQTIFLAGVFFKTHIDHQAK